MSAPVPRPVEDEDVFLTSEELAQRLRRSIGTLANWRLKKRGPAYVMPAGKGGPVLYRLSDIKRYERARTVAETAVKTA